MKVIYYPRESLVLQDRKKARSVNYPGLTGGAS